MKGVYLKFFVTEFSEYDGRMLYEWLVEQARRMGAPGVSVFRAMAGYGRHGKLHEESFFELAADLPIQVSFVMPDDLAKQYLDLLREHKLEVFYVMHQAEFGILSRD